jgi:hypothetical protein
MLGNPFTIHKNQLLDNIFSNSEKLRGYLLNLDIFYYKRNMPAANKTSEASSLDDAKTLILQNGIKDPIEVEGLMTPHGKKYKVIGGLRDAAIATSLGINEFLVVEIAKSTASTSF